MSVAQFVGVLLLASPFIGLAWFCFATDGWRMFLFVFGGTAMLLSTVSIGVYLIFGVQP